MMKCDGPHRWILPHAHSVKKRRGGIALSGRASRIWMHALCEIDIYVSHLSIMRACSHSKTRTDVECSSSLKHRCSPTVSRKHTVAVSGANARSHERAPNCRWMDVELCPAVFVSLTAIVRYLLEKFNSSFAHKELDPKSFYGPRSCYFCAKDSMWI